MFYFHFCYSGSKVLSSIVRIRRPMMMPGRKAMVCQDFFLLSIRAMMRLTIPAIVSSQKKSCVIAVSCKL